MKMHADEVRGYVDGTASSHARREVASAAK